MRFGENFLTYPDLFPARPSGEPWGDERLLIRFAGHVYAWTGLSATQADATRQRFGELCLPPDEESPAAMEIQVFRAATEDFLEAGRYSEVGCNQSHTPNAVRFAGFHFMSRLDWTPGLRAALWIPEDNLHSQSAIFVHFLRIIIAYYLLEQGGLLLHSAAVVNDGDAYIFLGPSGAGKSTISHLSLAAGHTVLNDDMNALRVTAEGVVVEKLPFAGYFGQKGGGATGVYPVRALIRLHKGSTPSLRVLRPAAAVAALLGCAQYVNWDPYRRDNLIDLLQALHTRLPVRALTFARDNRFWALLHD